VFLRANGDLAMKRLAALLILSAFPAAALAGNTSSNSSSNSSNGVHTQTDTVVTEDEYGRTVYVRRSVRVEEPGREPPRKWRQWREDDD
jgi:hypothetical protein